MECGKEHQHCYACCRDGAPQWTDILQVLAFRILEARQPFETAERFTIYMWREVMYCPHQSEHFTFGCTVTTLSFGSVLLVNATTCSFPPKLWASTAQSPQLLASACRVNASVKSGKARIVAFSLEYQRPPHILHSISIPSFLPIGDREGLQSEQSSLAVAGG